MNKTTLRADLPQNILLDVLKQNQGKWISGEILAKRLSMTRSAIWKKVGILKEEGYDISQYLIGVTDLLISPICSSCRKSVTG